ncbi:Ethylmalonyl-CoA decarboxylase [Blattella germanica]|nr:Ethylmalonyl-CoA decarboxylase [Blattella germanica]
MAYGSFKHRISGIMTSLWNIIQRCLHSSFRTKMFTNSKSVQYYNGPETPFAEIRKILLRSTGGSIDLVTDDDTGIAIICLNHPDRRNAISGKMMVDLENAVRELEGWSKGKGLIIYGADKNFCSGGDLNMARMFCNPDDGFRMATFMQKVLQQLESLPLISVALIEGTGAIGGGSEIAITSDFRLFTSDTGGIAFVHNRMGITPAWGGCTRLVRAIGYTKALDLMSTGRRVYAEEAMKIGLCDGIVSVENALEEVQDWLKVRIRSDVNVLKALKSMAHSARTMSYEMALNEEKRLFAPLWGGPANQAALSQHIKHR